MVKNNALALVLSLGIAFPLSAAAADTLVKFSGGIGVHPVSNVSGTATNPPTNSIFPEVTRNIVRGVNPAGQIWVIDNLKANVKVDGSIRVDGRGLLLAGGNNIGLNAGASVFATLSCAVPPALTTFTLHSTDSVTGVPLAANGDFRINDVLDTAPPAPCINPVLLIRNKNGQTWFAAGIQDLETDNDD